MPHLSSPHALLTSLYDAAVVAAQPQKLIVPFLPEKPRGRTIVIGAGKGSAQMARTVEGVWPGELEGLVVTRYGCSCPTKHIKIVEAAHPVPDQAGLVAAQDMLALLQGLTADDLVIALISGGGSALLPCPLGDMKLADEIALNETLLASGAPISVMNAIRKQVSGIKGGRLAAAAYPARVMTLVISDVPGDNPAMVASGPTVPDLATREEARKFVALYGIDLTPATARHLASETQLPPLASDKIFARNEVHVIGSAALSLEAAANKAREHGYQVAILSDAIEGEAKEVAKMHAALAREIVAKNQPFKRPIVLLSGGETSVTLDRKGCGGRNSAFLLSFALAIEGLAGVYALAADTDGIDGTEDNAGAFADGSSVLRMRAAGVDPALALKRHESFAAFQAVNDLFVTGPTGTNVNDFRAIIID